MNFRWKIICAYLIKKKVKVDYLYLVHDYLEDEIY
jgi:hypothetical protein